MSEIPQSKIVINTITNDKNTKGILSIIKGLIYLIKPIWHYGKKYIILSIIISSIQPLSTILSITFQQTVVDSISEKKGFNEIISLLIFYGALLLGLPLINNIWMILYKDKKHTEILAKINKDIYIKAINTDYKYFDNPEFFNNYTWVTSQYSTQVEASYNLIIGFFNVLIGIFALTTVIISNDYFIIVLTIISLIISSRVNFHVNKINYNKVNDTIVSERKKEYVHRTLYLKDYVAGLKSTNVAKFLLKKYDESNNFLICVIKKYMIKLFVFSNINEAISSILYLIIVAYLSFKIIIGDLSIGSFMAMITASTTLKSYLNNFFSLVSKSQEISIYSFRIKSFFNIESPIENNKNKGIKTPEGALSIELKDLNFSYDNSNFALKNLNFKINKGDKIAIVGENGAGKTTLTKLLLRLYDPSSGEIFVNGVSLKDYQINEYRKNIGVAFQDSPIYALSIAQNMSIYHEVNKETLDEIIKMFELDSVLKKSNSDYNSEVTREFDNNGLILSGGEQQKFSLSRLFTGEFGLLILDEPTSALDPLAEYKLNKIIFNKASTTTTIMISHRLSTTRDADCIFLFKDGEIVEKGTHNELMKLSGKYYEMFTKQAENYEYAKV